MAMIQRQSLHGTSLLECIVWCNVPHLPPLFPYCIKWSGIKAKENLCCLLSLYTTVYCTLTQVHYNQWNAGHCGASLSETRAVTLHKKSKLCMDLRLDSYNTGNALTGWSRYTVTYTHCTLIQHTMFSAGEMAVYMDRWGLYYIIVCNIAKVLYF